MIDLTAVLKRLEDEHPEWQSWLATVTPVICELQNRSWDEHVPPDLNWADARTPLLAGVTLYVDPERACNLLRTVSVLGDQLRYAPPVASSNGAGHVENWVLNILEAALNVDDVSLKAITNGMRTDNDMFVAVAALMAMPVLHACSRHYGVAVPEEWACNYCPICGSWPAFAEACGVDRVRYSRCARCGAAWHAMPLACPYCGMREHEALGSLTIEQASFVIEFCSRCSGYLKVFNRLLPVAPAEVFAEDLASVHLDIAATTRGYGRPSHPGYRLGIKVERADARLARRSA